jgi:hypothetical protein
MSILPRHQTPEPDPTYAGVNGPRIAERLTVDHPHAMIATRTFYVGHAAHLMYVREGQLIDDRSMPVLLHPDRFRRPTAADRQATGDPR